MYSEGAEISIDRELHLVDLEIRKQLRCICATDALLDEILDTFFQGKGKKLRPRLVMLSAFALRGESLRTPPFASMYTHLVSLAAAAELVHSASLMHDDVLDRALIRRGSESVNSRFGDKIAILAGDILYSRAFEVLVEESSRETILMLTSCVRRMCRGEITNLSSTQFDVYRSIIEDKTAALMSFCCEASVRAVCGAGDDRAAAAALERFGYCFGMVYQLTDDLCDGDSEAVLSHHREALALLKQHVDEAYTVLKAVPESCYKSDLMDLLEFVVNKSMRLTAAADVPDALTVAGR